MTDIPFNAWKYEEQTRIKHLVFADYFDKWVKIVGKFHGLNYFDCFGGIGAYSDDKGKYHYGSPVRAAQIIEENEKTLGRKAHIIIIDQNKENIENIKKIFKYLGIKVTPEYINNDFDKSVNTILDKYPNIAPTFFFIDPFGFKIKLSTLRRIMQSERCEILLNFMYNNINRFLTLPQIENVLTDLFGDDEWKKCRSLSGEFRENELVSCFRSKLKGFAKFVIPYQISFPDKDRTYYYLFHISKHVKGCSIMKSSFAAHTHGRTEYRGKMQNQLTIYEVGNMKIESIKRFLLGKYHNISKRFIEIIEDNIDETDFLESGITNSLKELEKEGKIQIKRNPPFTPKKKQKRISINEEDIIVFS